MRTNVKAEIPDLTPEALRDARNGLALSQEEAAREIGVAVSTYQHWEQGVSRPRNRMIREAAIEFILKGLAARKQASGQHQPAGEPPIVE